MTYFSECNPVYITIKIPFWYKTVFNKETVKSLFWDLKKGLSVNKNFVMKPKQFWNVVKKKKKVFPINYLESKFKAIASVLYANYYKMYSWS